MKLNKKFAKLHGIRRHRHHPVIHAIHRKHRISYRTLFYMKEYGTKSHVASVIMKESMKILVIAAIISSVGGMGLENVKEKLVTIIPLLIMLPALNDMIGDYGTIVSSKFTTMLYTGRISMREGVMKSPELRKLMATLFAVALITSLYIGSVSYGMAYYSGFAFDPSIFLKVMAVSVVCTMLLVGIIFLTSVAAGIWIYRKKEDPNNFLVPITTSLADFASMLLFSLIVLRLF
ncbi:MAG: magnesium transporter [Candidatus Aenigmarchaeota archaeon]|nr:magnesium transporter [Candidatus Aenigmarchaeota archaeon]